MTVFITPIYAATDFKFDRSKPIEITADSLIVTDTNKNAEFLGNVQVTQDNYKLTAHRIIIQYSDGNNDSNLVKTITAYKNVYLFNNNQQAAKAQTMIYNLETKILSLSGDVLLMYDKNILIGNAITLNTQTRYITVTGHKKQRIKAVLTLPK
jgi:lipopolysaccharide export system protein LptA